MYVYNVCDFWILVLVENITYMYDVNCTSGLKVFSGISENGICMKRHCTLPYACLFSNILPSYVISSIFKWSFFSEEEREKNKSIKKLICQLWNQEISHKYVMHDFYEIKNFFQRYFVWLGCADDKSSASN